MSICLVGLIIDPWISFLVTKFLGNSSRYLAKRKIRKRKKEKRLFIQVGASATRPISTRGSSSLARTPPVDGGGHRKGERGKEEE